MHSCRRPDQTWRPGRPPRGRTEPGAVVHVVCPMLPGEFLGQIVLLVGGPGRGDDGESARYHVPDPGKPGGHVTRCGLPRRGRQGPLLRISGVVRRSVEPRNPWANRPLTHAWPRFTEPSPAGRTVMITLSRVRPPGSADATIPTGGPGLPFDRQQARSPGSDRAPVDTISAPHKTQSDSAQGPPVPGATTVPAPRPVRVRANVPWISAQARTHRPQAIQRSRSSLTYGWSGQVRAPAA